MFLAKPPVMRWIRYRGWRLEEEKPEGERVKVHMRFDLAVMPQFALSFGGDVEVVEPIEFRTQVRDAALGIVKLYAQG